MPELSDDITGIPVHDIDSNIENYEIISWDLNPGDVVIHHPLILHGSSGNKSSNIRRRGLATEKPEEFNQLNEVWNLIYRSGHVYKKSLGLAKENNLLKASKELCSFLEASIGNGRRGPMPFLNSETK